MTEPLNEIENTKSIELCRIIEKNQRAKDISENIGKLISEGADINFQDYHGDTPMHLAVANRDFKCVEFLLKFYPDLDIKNEEDLTAEELAIELKLDDIEKLLKTAKNKLDETREFLSINDRFIHELACESLSYEENCAFNDDSTFKILRVRNCKNIFALLQNFNEEDFRSSLNESSHLFVIVVETSEALINFNENIFTSLSTIFDQIKPVIVQFMGASIKTITFYKEANSSTFHSICDLKEISKEGFQIKINSEVGSNLFGFIQALNSKIFGVFNGNLLEVKLKIVELKQEVFSIVVTKNVLLTRFLKLFGSIPFESSHLIDSLDYPGAETLLALLDLPFTIPEVKFKLSEEQRKLLAVNDDRGYNLLMIAIEKDNLEAVRFLVEISDLDETASDEKTAADIAWGLKRYQCLIELLKSDSQYPKLFDESHIDEMNPSNEELKAFIAERNKFHDAIKSGNIEEINKFIARNPRIKFAYNASNQSALTIALEANRSDVYSLLRSKRFLWGIDQELGDVSKSLAESVRAENRKHFEASDKKHLMFILSKTRFAFNTTNEESCLQVIFGMYQHLDEIPEIRSILKVIEQADLLEIVYDFNHPHIRDMDPTATENTRGQAYFASGFIYLAVANYESEFDNICGTLAHELTHYAMQLIYSNRCKSYELKDEETEGNFNEIVLELNKRFIADKSSLDPIIRWVFACYTSGVWHAELIVRVPHLLARYKNDQNKLKSISESYCKSLFDFFQVVTLPQIDEMRDFIKPKQKIGQLNILLGLQTTVWNSAIGIDAKHLNRSKLLDSFPEDKIKIISSNVPLLTLKNIFQLLFRKHGPSIENLHIFAESKSFSNSDSCSEILEMFKSSPRPFIIIDCGNNLEFIKAMWNKFIAEVETKSRGRIFLIIAEDKLLSMQEMTSGNSHNQKVSHLWTDLDEDSKTNLLTKEIFLNGHAIALNHLFTTDSVICDHLPLFDLITDQTLNINENKITKKFLTQGRYIDRSFIAQKLDDDYENYDGKTKKTSYKINLDGLLKEADEKKVVIISDIAGTGKSTTMFHISNKLKEDFPTHWISFVDLKQHIETFKQISKLNQNFPEFLSERIFKIGKTFDEQLFLQLFKNGKVVIMFDGFDEISPLCNDLMLDVIKSFDVKSGNQLWITTRSHLREDLEKSLKVFSFSIEPLTDEDQIELLVDYWKQKNSIKPNNDQVNFEEAANKLISRLSNVMKASSDLVKIPLQVLMIAEIYDDVQFVYDDFQFAPVDALNFYTIYQNFIRKKIQIWETKGELYKSDQHEINLQLTGMRLVHQQIALNYFFGSNNEFSYDEQEWPSEKISRIGIIYFESETQNARFVHETFAEYFVADFIFSKLRSEKTQVEVFGTFVDVLSMRRYQMVRLFLDAYFRDFQAFDKFAIRFSFFTETSLEEILMFSLIVQNVLLEGLETMLEFSNIAIGNLKTVNSKKTILKHKSDMNRNILMMACFSRKFSILESIWSFAKTILGYEELNNLLTETDMESANALNLTIGLCNKSCVQFLFRIVNEQLQEDDQKICCKIFDYYNHNIFQCAAFNSEDTEIFETLYNCTENILTNEDTKRLLMHNDSNGRNVLHLIIEMNEGKTLKNFLKVLKHNFDNDFQKQFLSAEGTFEEIAECVDKTFSRNFLSFAASKNNKDVLETLWSFAKTIFNKGELSNLLTQTDRYGLTALHVAIKSSTETVIEYLFSIVTENFEKAEQRILFQTISLEGRNNFRVEANDWKAQKTVPSLFLLNCNIFHCGADNFKAKKIFTTLLKLTETVLTNDEIKSLLTQNSYDKCNVLHFLLIENDDNALQDFLEMLKVHFDEDFQKQLLFSKESKYHRNSLSVAAWRNDRNVLKSLWCFAKNLLSKADLNNFLTETDKDGLNALQLAIKMNNKTVIEYLFSIVKKQFQDDELKTFIQNLTSDGGNIFHLAAVNSHDGKIFTTLRNCTKSVLCNEEIKNLLSRKNFDGYNVLHIAASGWNVFKNLWALAESVFDRDELKKFLKEKSKKGSNVLHLSINIGTEFEVNELCKIVTYQLSKEEQMEYFKNSDSDGDNFFHCAAINSKNEKIFSTFWTFMREILPQAEIKSLLLAKNEEGLNCLHLIATHNEKEALTELHSILREVLSPEELKQFLLVRSNSQQSVLQIAVTKHAQHPFLQTLVSILEYDAQITANDIPSLLK